MGNIDRLTISKIFEEHIKKSALVAHLKDLVNMPCLFSPSTPVGDKVADEEWKNETDRIAKQIQEIELSSQPILKYQDLFSHEQDVFNQELSRLRNGLKSNNPCPACNCKVCDTNCSLYFDPSVFAVRREKEA